MNTTTGQLTERIRRVWRAVRGAVADYNYASRRMTELAVAPDRYVFDPKHAPDTYADFLYRSSGPLAHEPSARARAAAHR